MSERTQFCSNCAHFDPYPGSNKGECRRSCAQPQNSCDAYQWPLTLATKWCGEWQAPPRQQTYEPAPQSEQAQDVQRLKELLAKSAEGNVALQARVCELCAENDGLLEARDKLQAFKDWVHQYLDAQGVPHHPPGTHGAEGCRIGDRMDWLMAKLRTAESCTATLQEERDRLHQRTLDLREQLGKAECERDALRVDLAMARGKIVDLEGLQVRVADLEHRLAQQTTTDTLVPEGSEP